MKTDCVFLVDNLAASKSFYQEVFQLLPEFESAEEVVFNLGKAKLVLIGQPHRSAPLMAELRLVQKDAETIYRRALMQKARGIPTGEPRVHRCLDPDGNVLTFVVPEETESYFIYFAGNEFLPERGETFAQVPEGYYFIGTGKRPGYKSYSSREEAEIALENRKALSSASGFLRLKELL